VTHRQHLIIFAFTAFLLLGGCSGRSENKPPAQETAAADHTAHETPAAPEPGRVPGRCETPVSQREGEAGCYLTTETQIGALPAPSVFWHLYHYPTREAAVAAQTPGTTVVDSFSKVWLYAIADQSWKPAGGEKVAVIGPLAVQVGKPYTARYMEAVFPPGMTTAMRGHRHSGPEAWYVLSGAQCLETSTEGLIQAKAGEGAMVSAGPAMSISGVGSETRRAVLLVLHPTDEPWTSPAPDWTPEGRCPK
jgi:quercetin dioxygenase-like cupin family protein